MQTSLSPLAIIALQSIITRRKHKKMTEDNRFINIETKLAYQEDLLQELNQVVITMQQQIDKLELRNQMLRDNLKQIEASLPSEANPNEQPPHY